LYILTLNKASADGTLDIGGNGGPGDNDNNSIIIAADIAKRNRNIDEDPSFFQLHEEFSIQQKLNQNGGRIGNIVSLPIKLFFPDENIYMLDPASTKDFSRFMVEAYVKAEHNVGSPLIFYD
jgi:hypothetical protein